MIKKPKIKIAVIFGFYLINFLIIFSTQLNIVVDVENPSITKAIEIDYSISNPKIAATSIWNKTWAIDDQDFRDIGWGIATDSKGNTYVVGRSEHQITLDLTAFLVKYDWHGNYIWNRTWHDEGGASYSGIVIDSSNYIYITGGVKIGGIWNVSTIKFDSEGQVKWNVTWGGQIWSYGYDIEIGKDDYIYVTGFNATTDGQDIILLKYNKENGNLEKYSIYETLGMSLGTDIAVDSFNYLYIAGTNRSASNKKDIILLKYDSDCNLKWNVTWNNPYGGTNDEGAEGIAIDTNNNIYVTGYNTTIPYDDIVLLKYNSQGTLLWQRTWDNSGYDDSGEGIDIDFQNYIYIVGYKQDTPGNSKTTLIKYNSTGDQVWNKTWWGDENDYARGVTVSNKTEILITGETFSFAIGEKPDMFIAKYYEIPDPIIPEIPPNDGDHDDDDDDDDDDNNGAVIPSYDIILIISTISIVVLILIKKCKK